MEEFKTAIGQIATFMICAQAIAHFRPKEVYGKYLRILLSVMILVQIFQPFCKLFWGISGQELYAGVEAFQRELDVGMRAAAEQSALVESRLENMSLLELQERLAEQEQIGMEGQNTEQGGASDGNKEIGETDVGNKIDKVERVEVDLYGE